MLRGVEFAKPRFASARQEALWVHCGEIFRSEAFLTSMAAAAKHLRSERLRFGEPKLSGRENRESLGVLKVILNRREAISGPTTEIPRAEQCDARLLVDVWEGHAFKEIVVKEPRNVLNWVDLGTLWSSWAALLVVCVSVIVCGLVVQGISVAALPNPMLAFSLPVWRLQRRFASRAIVGAWAIVARAIAIAAVRTLTPRHLGPIVAIPTLRRSILLS